jgi:hypothetical protein
MLRGSWSVEWRPKAFAIVKRAEASTTGFATWMPRGIIVHCSDMSEGAAFLSREKKRSNLHAF